MVRSGGITVVVEAGAYTLLSLYISAYRVEPSEAFLVYGQLTDEFGNGINGGDIDIYVDGAYNTTVKTTQATDPEGNIVNGYYSKTYIISQVDKYKFQTKFKGGDIEGVTYSPVASESKVIGVGTEPEDFYLLSVRAFDIKTEKDLQISFVYDTLSRKTPYLAKLSVTGGLTFTFKFPEVNGVKFVKWEDDSTDPTRTVTVSADTALIAYYEVVAPIDWLKAAVIIIGISGLIYIISRG